MNSLIFTDSKLAEHLSPDELLEHQLGNPRCAHVPHRGPLYGISFVLVALFAVIVNGQDHSSSLDSDSEYSAGSTTALDDLVTVARIRGHDILSLSMSSDGSVLLSLNLGPGSAVNNRGSVDIIDTDGDGFVGSVELGVGFPLQATMTQDASLAFIAVSQAAGTVISNGSNRIDVIDLASQSVLTSIAIGGNAYGPAGIALSPDESKLYVGHRGSERVDIVDTDLRSHTGSIAVGSEVIEVSFVADGTRAYAASRLPTLRVIAIDAITDTFVSNISTSLLTSGSWANITIDSVTMVAYVTSSGDSRISVIDVDPSSANYH